MTDLLLRLFVKNYQDPNDPAVHSAVGKLAGVTGIVCNTMLFLGKLIAGMLVGSVAIVADAVNNLSDAASSVVTLLGFRLAQRPADKDHPFGHARYEYLSGLVVAALILLIGAELVKSSVGKMIHPEPMEFTMVTFAILLFSIAVKLWMSVFFRSLGNRIHSTTLAATSADSRNDVIATSAVALGCLVNRFFRLNIDGYVGLAVAVFILYSGVKIAKDTISPLLGKQADDALLNSISQLVLSHEKVLGIHDLLVHDYGPGQCFASVHAELNAADSSLACHDILDDIERDALAQLNVHLVIHFDPVMTDDPEWNALQKTVDQIVRDIDGRLSIHDFRMVRDEQQTKLAFDLAVPYDMDIEEQQLRQEICQAMALQKIPYPAIIHFDGKA